MVKPKPKRLSAWQRRIFIAWFAAVCSFMIGIFMPPGQPSASGGGFKLSLPLPAFNLSETPNQEAVTAKAVAKKQVEELKSSMLVTWEQEAKAKNFISTAPARFRGKTINQAKLSPGYKLIALTFDDGPWPKTTEQVLDILKKNDVKATFFMIGKHLEYYPAIAQKVVAEGHALGNHTWHHWYHRMNPATAKSEIDRTSALIHKVTGVKTLLFRPPGGMLHNGLVNYAQKNNYLVAMWSSDTHEFARYVSPQSMVNDVLHSATPGGIVLMHDGGGNHDKTVKALPQIIAKLKQRGYRFATIPELLNLQDQEESLVTAQK